MAAQKNHSETISVLSAPKYHIGNRSSIVVQKQRSLSCMKNKKISVSSPILYCYFGYKMYGILATQLRQLPNAASIGNLASSIKWSLCQNQMIIFQDQGIHVITVLKVLKHFDVLNGLTLVVLERAFRSAL